MGAGLTGGALMGTVGIGDAARAVGVEAHVLRHWEDVGVLRPERSPAGHRRYPRDSLDTARLILRAQRTGLSLAEIRTVLAADDVTRRAVVAERLDALREQIVEATATVAFLEHTLSCSHPVIGACPECSAYVGREVTA